MNNSRLANLAKLIRRHFRASWIAPFLLLLALPLAVQAQFTHIITNGTVTITGYTGSGGAVTIPGTIAGLPVTRIGDSAFNGCANLTSMTIPDSVTSIGDDAFSLCIALTNVTIGNSVTTIGYQAFTDCYLLASVTIPNRARDIGGEAFFDCSSVVRVTIPDGVVNIGDWAFGGCSSLTAITVGPANPSYSSVDGVLLNKSQTVLIQFPGGKAGSPYVLPNGVANIAGYAFSYCARLSSVTIPNTVTSIGDRAFFNCSSLMGVYFEGCAPSLGGPWVFQYDQNIVYYLRGITGWGPTFGGRPTAVWDVPPPIIQRFPLSQTAEAGSTVLFSVEATNALPVWYVWYNQTNFVACGKNPNLQLTNVQLSQSGAYMVAVTNAAGSVTSPPALLNVIAPVERRIVPALTLMGQPGTSLNLDFTAALGSAAHWTTFDQVPLTANSQWYFDLGSPLTQQRFYRAWQSSGGTPPALNLHFIPALTLTGAIGNSLHVDYINQFGPIDAWVTNLATVTLTNTVQLYFDTSIIGQPPRLWRIVPVP